MFNFSLANNMNDNNYFIEINILRHEEDFILEYESL